MEFDWKSQIKKDAVDAAKHRVLKNVRYAVRNERKSEMAIKHIEKLETELEQLKQEVARLRIPQSWKELRDKINSIYPR